MIVTLRRCASTARNWLGRGKFAWFTGWLVPAPDPFCDPLTLGLLAPPQAVVERAIETRAPVAAMRAATMAEGSHERADPHEERAEIVEALTRIESDLAELKARLGS